MSNKLNLIGQTYYRLTVIRESSIKYSDNKLRWECLCECGNATLVDTHSLRSGNTKSCGCLQKEIARTHQKTMYLKAVQRNTLPKGQSAKNTAYGGYKSGAKRRGLSFEITIDEFINLSQKNCFYCNATPNNEPSKKVSRNGTFIYNGIDRVNNTEGYTVDNVVPCCAKCNRAKLTMSLQDFEDWIERAYNTLQQRRNNNDV